MAEHKANIVTVLIKGKANVICAHNEAYERHYYEAAWRMRISARGMHKDLTCCVDKCRASGCNAIIYICTIACEDAPSENVTVPLCEHCSRRERVYVRSHTKAIDYNIIQQFARYYENHHDEIRPAIRKVLPPLPVVDNDAMDCNDEEPARAPKRRIGEVCISDDEDEPRASNRSKRCIIEDDCMEPSAPPAKRFRQ